MSKRGLLIVFEGCDRSGKSTQARKLIEALKSKGQNAKFMRFPERQTTIGGVIGEYLEKKKEMNDHAVHLLFSANRWEFYDEMKKDLMNGTSLVVDRYAFSGVAYTSSKGYSLDWCKGPDRGLLAPDVVFYLDIPLEKMVSRGGYGDERYETDSFQAKVYNSYNKLKDDSWKVINADRSIDEIHAEIIEITSLIEKEKSNSNPGCLWPDEEQTPSAEIKGKLKRKHDGSKKNENGCQ